MTDLLPARMADKILPEPNSGCWLWTGAVASGGYGYSYDHGATNTAHRIVYERIVGRIPDGLHLDHLCRVRSCVNPAHLEPVTIAENNRRADHWCLSKQGHQGAQRRQTAPRRVRAAMTCEACRRPYLECACHEVCRLCACLTNHTTAQHLAAEEARDGDE